MDQKEQSPENQQTEQAPVQPILAKQANERNPWKYCAIGLILILVILIAYYFISMNKPPLKEAINTVPSTAPTTSNTSPETTKTFQDKRLEGMQFTYDPSQWEVISFSREDKAIVDELKFNGSGILLRDKQSNGKLQMNYWLPFGTDGYVTLVTPERLVNLQNNLIRVENRDPGGFAYGLSSALVLFSDSPKDYEQLLTTCETERKKPGQQPLILDTQSCNELETKKTIGLINGPTLEYSLRFKNLVKLTDFDSSWETQQDEPYEGYIIVAVSYTGSNPTEADKIVQQIVK